MTLVLNASFEPLKIVDWQRAITLFYRGKAEIVHTYEREAHSVSFTFRVPSVVRLLRFVRVKGREDVVPFTRANIYARDGYRCGYCGEQHPDKDLTFDHVIPSSKGGSKGWENIVTACVPCNRRKDARTPEEARMPLLWEPKRPTKLGVLMRVTLGYRTAPADWRSYLYWHATLEEA